VLARTGHESTYQHPSAISNRQPRGCLAPAAFHSSHQTEIAWARRAPCSVVTQCSHFTRCATVFASIEHGAAAQSSCSLSPVLRSSTLCTPESHALRSLRRPPIDTAMLTLAPYSASTVLSARQRLPASGRDPISPHGCLVFHTWQAPQPPAKTDAPPLLSATCADTESLTPQISASATALTLLSATQHSQASEHDAAALSGCRVSPMLQTPQLPPKRVRH